MTTNTFKVTYANGATSETITDDFTVEAFCNSHFGSTWPAAQENGATVELVTVNEDPVDPVDPVDPDLSNLEGPAALDGSPLTPGGADAGQGAGLFDNTP